MRYLPFYTQFISLKIMICSSIYVVINHRLPTFPRLKYIYIYIYIYVIFTLSTHHFMDIQTASIFLCIVNSVHKQTNVGIFDTLISFYLDIIRGIVPRSYSSFIFSFLIFSSHNDYANLCPSEPDPRIFFPLYPLSINHLDIFDNYQTQQGEVISYYGLVFYFLMITDVLWGQIHSQIIYQWITSCYIWSKDTLKFVPILAPTLVC